jgi:hypothetical protein
MCTLRLSRRNQPGRINLGRLRPEPSTQEIKLDKEDKD